MSNRATFVASDARISIEPDGRTLIHIRSKRIMINEAALGEWDAAVFDELGNPLVHPETPLDGTLNAALRWVASMPDLPYPTPAIIYLQTSPRWMEIPSEVGSYFHGPDGRTVQWSIEDDPEQDRAAVAQTVAAVMDTESLSWSEAIERIKGA